jgi:glycosyltransferase involved in cell wall biosynthesis
MRLLVFCPYYPPHPGGLENYAQELHKYLEKKVTSITIFTTNLPDSGDSIEEISKKITLVKYPAVELVTNYPIPKFWKPL